MPRVRVRMRVRVRVRMRMRVRVRVRVRSRIAGTVTRRRWRVRWIRRLCDGRRKPG